MAKIKKCFQCKGKEFTPYKEWDDTYHFEEITKKLEKWEIRIEITHPIFNGLELEMYDRDINPIHYELEFEENAGEMKPYQNNSKNRLFRKNDAISIKKKTKDNPNEREREREREQNYPTEIWNTAIRTNC